MGVAYGFQPDRREMKALLRVSAPQGVAEGSEARQGKATAASGSACQAEKMVTAS